MRKMQIPEGMLKAAVEVQRKRQGYPHPDSKDNAEIVRTVEYALEAALRWLSENPIVPDKDTANRLITCRSIHSEADPFAEWQRRMFLAPEPEIPEIWMPFVRNAPYDAVAMTIYGANETVLAKIDLEAYRRGLRSK